MNNAVALARAIAFFEQISPSDVARLDEIYAADAYFRDPFNEVFGVAAIARVYANMFEQLDDCRFVVADTIADDKAALLIWDFTFRIRRWRPHKVQTIHGASHVRFTADGKIGYHRDYWDTAEELYAKLPLIGSVMRFLRRRLS